MASSRAPEKPPSALPAKTPALPPQFLACDGLDFYRITDDSLHVFQASKEVPPPQLRGSATASHSARIEVGAPQNVVVLGDGSVVVAAEKNLFRYQKGAKQADPAAPLPSTDNVLLWRDPTSADSFWVRTLGEKELQRYTWPANAPASPEPAKLTKRAEALPGFDARVFAVLSDGAVVYSTAKGLLRPGNDAPAAPLPPLSKPDTLLFADASADRYWTAEPQGAIALRNLAQPEPPVLSTRVPGVVIDTATQGDRVAVLSMELKNQAYRPSVTVFAKGRQRGQLSIGPSAAHLGQPKLDVCLIEGRPWVVVGGPHWLHLLDFTGPRLLAEW